MRYAINENGKLVIKIGDMDGVINIVWPAPETVDCSMKIDKIEGVLRVVQKSPEDIRLEQLPDKYKIPHVDDYGNYTFIEKTQEEKMAIDATEAEAQAVIDQANAEAQSNAEAQALIDAFQADIDFQNNKSMILKAIENIYVDFLINMWTPLLREKGIIAEDFIITVDNTDSIQNIMYLMQLRSLDFSKYGEMAGEFERLKNTIVNMGGKMDKVQVHSL